LISVSVGIADSTLLDTASEAESSCGGETTVSGSQILAQAFTINTAITVSRINLLMTGFGTDRFRLQLVEGIGPLIPSSFVKADTSATFPNTGGFAPGVFVSIPINVSLEAG